MSSENLLRESRATTLATQRDDEVDEQNRRGQNSNLVRAHSGQGFAFACSVIVRSRHRLTKERLHFGSVFDVLTQRPEVAYLPVALLSLCVMYSKRKI